MSLKKHLSGISGLYHVKTMKAVGLTVLAAGLVTPGFSQMVPWKSYREFSAPNKGDVVNFYIYDLDFTKTSANPAINYPTFPNPRNPQAFPAVKYHTHDLAIGTNPGACFEIISSGPVGSDVILSVQNQAGSWMWLADDNNGNGQFRARVYIKPTATYHIRMSEYSSPNNNNQNVISVYKINADPGAAITATSCRLAGVPFWQYDLNGGLPYNPS